MALQRPKRLKYHGRQVPKTIDPDGTVLTTQGDHYFQGVPDRDLDEDDMARLSDEQITTIMAASYGDGTLYSDPDTKKATPEKASSKKRLPAKREAPKKVPSTGLEPNPLGGDKNAIETALAERVVTISSPIDGAATTTEAPAP